MEIFTHHLCVHNILHELQSQLDIRLTAVHLIDAYHCSDAALFISAVLLSLTTMIRLELPHINVLSKIDLVERHGVLPFNLDFFTECSDLRRLLDYIDSGPFIEHHTDDGVIENQESQIDEKEPMWKRRYRKMNEEICDVVEDYGLVSFYTLDVQDKHSMSRILRAIDKGNGFVLTRSDGNMVGDIFQSSLGELEPSFEGIADVQDRYMERGFPDVQRNSSTVDQKPSPNFEKEICDETPD